MTFHLEDFDGPLELLLTLVQAHKMDLHNIPILALIDQYTAVVTAAQVEEPEVASSFIEMAARLVEMKSWLLLPRSQEAEQMKQELTGRPDRVRPVPPAGGPAGADGPGGGGVHPAPGGPGGRPPLPAPPRPSAAGRLLAGHGGQGKAPAGDPGGVRAAGGGPLCVGGEPGGARAAEPGPGQGESAGPAVFTPGRKCRPRWATFLAVLELVRAGRLEIADGRRADHPPGGGWPIPAP